MVGAWIWLDADFNYAVLECGSWWWELYVTRWAPLFHFLLQNNPYALYFHLPSTFILLWSTLNNSSKILSRTTRSLSFPRATAVSHCHSTHEYKGLGNELMRRAGGVCVYVSPAFCKRAKDLLQSLGVEFFVIELDQDCKFQCILWMAWKHVLSKENGDDGWCPWLGVGVWLMMGVYGLCVWCIHIYGSQWDTHANSVV